jgi:hypothetical protein
MVSMILSPRAKVRTKDSLSGVAIDAPAYVLDTSAFNSQNDRIADEYIRLAVIIGIVIVLRKSGPGNAPSP